MDTTSRGPSLCVRVWPPHTAMLPRPAGSGTCGPSEFGNPGVTGNFGGAEKWGAGTRGEGKLGFACGRA